MSSTTNPAASATSQAPSSSPSSPPPAGPSNSPLLFFVALGFGVVFTNLWIIVGVKYCFRYNARNRARQHDENGEPIDLVNMQQHRRRRREKKLMSLDEVNERFPILKYKSWVSRRAAEGMPTEGGVNQNRAASIRDAEGVIEPIGESSKSIVAAEVASTAEAQPSSPTTSTPPKDTTNAEAPKTGATEKTIEATPQPHVHDHDHPHDHGAMASTARDITAAGEHGHEHDDEEDGIAAAVPGAAEMLEAPGDSCAICIDTLEENDDVRGLSCGHAFHASCIDPWLTNRRACCPLCKADYYVPKARPEQAGADDASPEQASPQTSEQTQPVAGPGSTTTSPGMIIGRFMPNRRSQTLANAGTEANVQVPAPTLGNRFTSAFRRGGARDASTSTEEPSAAPAAAPLTPSASDDGQPARNRRWAPSLSSWRRGRAQDAEQATPGQLEAGNNNTTTATTTNV